MPTFRDLISELIPQFVNWPLDQLEDRLIDYFEVRGFDPNSPITYTHNLDFEDFEDEE